MKNANKAVRDAYAAALAGVTYNGNTVPVYKTTPVETTPDHYIVISIVDATNDANDARFIRNVSITLDIVTTTYRYRTYDVADNIGLQVMDTILPGIGGNLTDADFQFGHIQLDFDTYLEGTRGEYYITRKILTFNQSLIQK